MNIENISKNSKVIPSERKISQSKLSELSMARVAYFNRALKNSAHNSSILTPIKVVRVLGCAIDELLKNCEVSMLMPGKATKEERAEWFSKASYSYVMWTSKDGKTEVRLQMWGSCACGESRTQRVVDIPRLYQYCNAINLDTGKRIKSICKKCVINQVEK